MMDTNQTPKPGSEDYPEEEPDFTLADKEWIDLIDPATLTWEDCWPTK